MLLTNGRPPSLERFLNDNDTKLDPLIPGPVFSLPAHILIASRAYLDSPAIPLNVDMHELRRGRVRITTDFNHLALYDVGRIVCLLHSPVANNLEYMHCGSDFIFEWTRMS